MSHRGPKNQNNAGTAPDRRRLGGEEGGAEMRSVRQHGDGGRAPARQQQQDTVTRSTSTNSGILCRVMPGARRLQIVVMKLMAPRIDEAPARGIRQNPKSTEGPGWN